MAIRVVDWQNFQHYKDRCPPWIKLYRTLLDNDDWGVLSEGARALLIECWCVAAEKCDGVIDRTLAGLARRVHRELDDMLPLLSELIGPFLEYEHDDRDGDLLASCLQDASNALATCLLRDKGKGKGLTRVQRFQLSETGNTYNLFERVSAREGGAPNTGEETDWEEYFHVEKSQPNKNRKPLKTTPRKPNTWHEVPPDWQPNEKHRELAQGLDVNMDAEVEKFRDHYFARPKKNADRTFNNWLRNSGAYGGGRKRPDNDMLASCRRLLTLSGFSTDLIHEEAQRSVFKKLARDNPALWAKAGDVFARLRFIPLLDARNDDERLGRLLQAQLKELDNGRK